MFGFGHGWHVNMKGKLQQQKAWVRIYRPKSNNAYSFLGNESC
jgi:hypothetical protein